MNYNNYTAVSEQMLFLVCVSYLENDEYYKLAQRIIEAIDFFPNKNRKRPF